MIKNVMTMAILMLLLNSCKKSTENTSSMPSTNSNLWVSKIVSQSIGRSGSLTFGYDSSKRVISYSQINYDSAHLSQPDVNNYTFSYKSNDSLPSSYTYHYNNYLNGVAQPQIENHLLYYNSQKQVLKDTVTTTNLNKATIYTYLPGIIITTTGNYVDSFYYSNQNFTRLSYYDYGSLSHYQNFTYSSYLNPLYPSRGTLQLCLGGFFSSKYLPETEISSIYSSFYSYTVDANGNILKVSTTSSYLGNTTATFYYVP